MRQPLVAGNWKMHGDRARSAALVGGIVAGLGRAVPVAAQLEIVVCPPAVLIPDVAKAIADTRIRLGGQNLCRHDEGAYTGEISGAMLADAGCWYCIVGHSERRMLYGETDEVVADKFTAARRSGLTPILCVGETLDERAAGRMETVVGGQLDSVANRVGDEGLAGAVVAYEPVWAIGTGRTATPEQVQEAHRFIRERVASRDRGASAALRVLYGGSVKPDNAASVFSQPDVDGGLIGGASLKAEQFLDICAAWSQHK